jgi:predicted aspartyl protease
MGRIRTTVRVGNFLVPEIDVRFDALVDTGAYCLTLPAAWKERFGELPLREMVELRLADHRVVQGEIRAPLRIQIGGFAPCVGEALFIDMPEEAEPLIGYLTLEQAKVVVDMVGRRLVRVPYLDLKHVAPAAA